MSAHVEHTWTETKLTLNPNVLAVIRDVDAWDNFAMSFLFYGLVVVTMGATLLLYYADHNFAVLKYGILFSLFFAGCRVAITLWHRWQDERSPIEDAYVRLQGPMRLSSEGDMFINVGEQGFLLPQGTFEALRKLDDVTVDYLKNSHTLVEIRDSTDRVIYRHPRYSSK